jgi:hypothetical protein
METLTQSFKLGDLPIAILENLVRLAKIPVEHPGHGASVSMNGLTSLLPTEFHEDFNSDMAQCITMLTHAQFDLSPNTIATNILPHYANFIAAQLSRSIVNYSRYGYPTQIKITVDASFLAVVEIQWLYSVEGVIETPSTVE